MNIDSSGPSYKLSKPDLSSKGSGAAATSSASRSAGAAPATASPTLTPGSAHAAAAQLMSTHADFDAAKVAEIRASISAGCYVVNTGRIADGLLASARELVQKAQP